MIILITLTIAQYSIQLLQNIFESFSILSNTNDSNFRYTGRWLTLGSCSQHFLMRSANAGGQLLGRVGRYRETYKETRSQCSILLLYTTVHVVSIMYHFLGDDQPRHLQSLQTSEWNLTCQQLPQNNTI